MSDHTTGAAAHDAAAPPGASVSKGDKAQYGVCLGLVVLAVTLIVDALRLDHVATANDPVGPKPVPIILGVLLIVTATLYAIDVWRGGTGPAEEGEDVDLDVKSDWRTLGLLAGFFLLNALLIEPLGWVISSTILFAGSAYALGNRHVIRSIAIGVGLALVTFYGFAIGLGINLPAGILEGIL